MRTPEDILKQYWGYDTFRPLQKDIINSVLGKTDTLALLPTGGGKSLCYQVPALIMDGFCLVVSPLIALMQDQVSRLAAQDIPAACIYSGMHYSEVRRTLDNAMQGGYKLLYVSPERLQTRLFGDYMAEFDVSMIAVDEAHCISQWGHDFRPSYLKIANIREVYPDAPVLALTASATTDVQLDIATQLDFHEAIVFRQSFARKNIFYDIRYSENKNGDTFNQISNLKSQNPDPNFQTSNSQFPIPNSTNSTLIYCRSRKQTEAISRYLQQNDINAVAYHAGMTKELRSEMQELWMKDKAPVMAATTAFGMGIDKAGVRMVLHYDAPEHLEAWYQEAGRAGRDGKPAHALTLYNSADIKRLQESIALQYPPEEYLRQVYQAVVEYLQVPIGAEPDQYYPFDTFDFCSKFSLRSIEAIYALKLLEQEGLWTLSEAVYSPATIQFTVDRHTLDSLEQAHPDLYYVTVGLLRMYNTIFHFPTPVRETAIARQLRIPLQEVALCIGRLNGMGVLRYNKPGDGPQMFFHHYRVDSRYLIIDLNRIHILRKRHEARTEAMVAFLENKDICRERIFLTYFGEEPESDCGHCDVCRNKQAKQVPAKDLKKAIRDILQTKSMTLQQLIANYPPVIMEQALTCIREMIDNGELSMKDNELTTGNNK